MSDPEMPDKESLPEKKTMAEPRTCVIFVGASRFPRHGYRAEPVFLRSKKAVEKRIFEQAIPPVSEDGVLDLFNSIETASEQLTRIGVFLAAYDRRHKTELPRNLIFYYVGHGYFYGKNHDYLIALASTESENESSGLRIVDLAAILSKNANGFRRFIILDCCFSAEALQAFQGQGEYVAALKAAKAFASDSMPQAMDIPIDGTALLCALNKESCPIRTDEDGCTIFSGALVKSLYEGDWRYGECLSIQDILDMINVRLEERHRDHVRPELHAPDQINGNIATRVRLFSNRANGQNKFRIFNEESALGTDFGPTHPRHFLYTRRVSGRPTVQNVAALILVAISFALFAIWDHSHTALWPGAFFVPVLVLSCCILAVINSRNFFEAVALSSLILGALIFINVIYSAPDVPLYTVIFLVVASTPICAISVFVIDVVRTQCRKVWRNLARSWSV